MRILVFIISLNAIGLSAKARSTFGVKADYGRSKVIVGLSGIKPISTTQYSADWADFWVTTYSGGLYYNKLIKKKLFYETELLFSQINANEEGVFVDKTLVYMRSTNHNYLFLSYLSCLFLLEKH